MDRTLVQQRFWQPIYNRLSWAYDAVDWFTGNTTHRLRRRIMPFLPDAGSRVLEIGMGSGKLHMELAPHYDMAGIDLAPGMVELTRRRLSQRRLSSLLAVADACALPWPAATFDAVFSTFVFSAIPNAARALDEMIRITRPGGKVILVDAGPAEDGNSVAQLLALTWELVGDYMRDEAALMTERGLAVRRMDFGPYHAVHVVVGQLPVTAHATNLCVNADP